MRTTRKIILFLIFCGFSSALFAQSIDEGKKSLYYERYTSAKDVLSKLVAANPANVDAAYWLGQTLIGMENVAGAKEVYQKALSASPSAPLLLVGMGHVELLENKTNDARNRFETAISLGKGKDVNAIIAVGRANADAKVGDAVYAIEKLKAIADKNAKNAELQMTLGDLYRKLADGGNSQVAYENALAVDPGLARASFMIGRVYQTQGRAQEPIYMKYYNEAMAKDAKYAPVYYWLYEYYYRLDINKSRDYLDKYIANTDQNSNTCYYQVTILYASGKFRESIAQATSCLSTYSQNPDPNLYGVQAYAYDRMGDSVNAKKLFETFFAKQKQEKFGPMDYATYGRILLKFPGNEVAASQYIEKAVALDTLEINKIDYLSQVAAGYVAAQKFQDAANWYKKILAVKKNFGKTDLYNAGYNYYKTERYAAADSVYAMYIAKYPTELYGYKWSAKSREGIDTTRSKGLANPMWQKVIELGEASADTAAVKADLLSAYNYMVAYNFNILKDITAAITYNDKVLLRDPTNANALTNKEALAAALKRQQNPPKATNPPPKKKP